MVFSLTLPRRTKEKGIRLLFSILMAESNPKEKDKMIGLIINLINEQNE